IQGTSPASCRSRQDSFRAAANKVDGRPGHAFAVGETGQEFQYEDFWMKIAQNAPLAESVPPKLYGRTERIESYLTEELVRQGHDVTLFASGDSQTSAELVPVTEMALRLNPKIIDPIPYHMMLLESVMRRADEFDALHFHIDILHMPMVRDCLDRTVTTLHGR